jgi:hypothetical protein
MLRKIFFTLSIFIYFSSFSQELTATVKTVGSVNSGQDFIVELTVTKPASIGFIKYFQDLPGGYSATNIESKGGDFTFADNGAKIVWVSPPIDNQYNISYKITTPENINEIISIGGKFSYIINNERKVFDVVLQKVSVKSQNASASIKDQPKEVEILKEKPPKIITTPAKAPATASDIIPGKTYKVQIGAFVAKPKIDGVVEISTVILDNGVTKYFSGNFKTYEEAAKRKKELLEKGFVGAFVVSFENGKIVK